MKKFIECVLCDLIKFGGILSRSLNLCSRLGVFLLGCEFVGDGSRLDLCRVVLGRRILGVGRLAFVSFTFNRLVEQILVFSFESIFVLQLSFDCTNV